MEARECDRSFSDDELMESRYCIQDCFACRSGECIALERSASECGFYSTPLDNHRAIMRCFYRLIGAERFDLLLKYRKVLVRFGIFDEEMRSACDHQRTIELYGIIDMYKQRNHLEGEWEEPAHGEEESGTDQEQNDLEAESLNNELVEVTFPNELNEKELENANTEAVKDWVLANDGYEEMIVSQDDRMNVETEKAILSIAAGGEYVDPEEGSVETVSNDVEDAAQKLVSIMMHGEVYIRWRSIMPGALVLREKQLPDPVDDAYALLGGGIIYNAVEDYIETLKRIWMIETSEGMRVKLIVKKWKLETFFGSAYYWRLTNLDPEKIMDCCWKTAEYQAKQSLRRKNLRVLAGVENE